MLNSGVFVRERSRETDCCGWADRKESRLPTLGVRTLGVSECTGMDFNKVDF